MVFITLQLVRNKLKGICRDYYGIWDVYVKKRKFKLKRKKLGEKTRKEENECGKENFCGSLRMCS